MVRIKQPSVLDYQEEKLLSFEKNIEWVFPYLLLKKTKIPFVRGVGHNKHFEFQLEPQITKIRRYVKIRIL